MAGDGVLREVEHEQALQPAEHSGRQHGQRVVLQPQLGQLIAPVEERGGQRGEAVAAQVQAPQGGQAAERVFPWN